MAPRFLIDENLSPALALHLRHAMGFDAVHVNAVGLAGATDADVVARAIAEDRVIITGNGDDFRKLGRRHPSHPGLAIITDAGGRARQIELGVILAEAIDTRVRTGGTAAGRLFEINRTGIVIEFPLP
jgi:predicted nuclease of predicted toxin-antitoxin system